MAKVEHHHGGVTVGEMDKEERRGKRKKLQRMEVSRAKNGGHVVRHHFKSGSDMGYAEPQEHVFGKDDGSALLAHLARHLGIKGLTSSEPDEEA